MGGVEHYEQERDGGYLWSPKRKKDGSKDPFYEYMREVVPGDVVFARRVKIVGLQGAKISLDATRAARHPTPRVG